MKTILHGQNVTRIFQVGEDKNRVLDRVTVEIYEGDFTIIMGPSGAGKSTLLYALSGMESINDGTVLYRGHEINRYNEAQKARLRAQEFGFVFQQTHLVSNLTLFENIAVAGYVSKTGNSREIQERTRQLMRQMDVERAGGQLPSQVSGGEAQRAAIARAVIGKPGLLFADEPTGALNKSNSIVVLDLLTGLAADGQSIVMVTHDLRAAVRGTRLLYLEDGKILDEMRLSPYEKAEEKDRESRINAWLSHLRW